MALPRAARGLGAACGDAARPVGVVPDLRVLGPVLVLGRGVVEILGGEDEGGQEDAVGCAAQSLGLGLQTGLEAVQVHQCGHERGHLDVGGPDQVADELL